MFSRLRSDVQCILERDPAARSTWEVLTCYPGLHAVILHRLAHGCWTHGFKWLGRFISHIARWATGIEIHPGAIIGERVFFDHAMGVVVGDGAKIGSNAVVINPVPPGATAVGIPARIIPSKEGHSADVTEDAKPKPQFTAYGITQEDDPLSLAMRGLIDSAASQEHQIALLWQAIEKLSDCVKTGDCVPDDAALKEQFEAGKLNDLVGK